MVIRASQCDTATVYSELLTPNIIKCEQKKNTTNETYSTFLFLINVFRISSFKNWNNQNTIIPNILKWGAFFRWSSSLYCPMRSVRPWKYENRDYFAPSQWNRNLKNVFSRIFSERMTLYSVTLYGISMYTRIDVFVYARIVFLGIWSFHLM